MRATYSPSTLGMHHMSLRHGLRPFSASRRRTVSCDRLSCSGSLTMASASSSSGFLLARELALRPRPGVLAQRPFQIAFHEAPLGAVHGGAAHRHGAGNLLVAAAGVRRQQYLGALELAGGSLAFTQHRGELAAFGLAQFDMIKYIHLGLLVGAPDESTYESKIRRCASFQWARLHRKARPVSGLHLRLFAH